MYTSLPQEAADTQEPTSTLDFTNLRAHIIVCLGLLFALSMLGCVFMYVIWGAVILGESKVRCVVWVEYVVVRVHGCDLPSKISQTHKTQKRNLKYRAE